MGSGKLDSFSYLSVLLSIIIGLAVTQVLQGLRVLMLSRETARLYAPSLIWTALLLLIATQMWWSAFGLRRVRHRKILEISGLKKSGARP